MPKKLHRLAPAPATAHRIEPRIRLTDKGRALLDVLDARHALERHLAISRAFDDHARDRAAPCAPKRAAPVAPAAAAAASVTPAARPRTPPVRAARPLAPEKDTR